MTDIEVLSTKARTFLGTAEPAMSVGDYGVGLSIAQDEAEHLLETARDFIQKVRTYLDQWMEKEAGK